MWCGCQKHNKERFIAESAGKKVLKSANIWQSCNQEGGCLVHFVCLATTLLENVQHNAPMYA